MRHSRRRDTAHTVYMSPAERAAIRAKCKIRNCLRCRAPFPSEHAGNRMCDPCRGVEVSPFQPGTTGDAGGRAGPDGIGPVDGERSPARIGQVQRRLAVA